jgi:hypothetical protein
MCNIIFFLLMWTKKTTCRLASVQYHFFSSPMCKKIIITCGFASVQSFRNV